MRAWLREGPEASFCKASWVAGVKLISVEPHLQVRRPPVSIERTSVGLDVHALSGWRVGSTTRPGG